MEWWQSLLIALIPSILTASITLTVSLVQIKRAKTEIEAKHESDRKQHISRMRLDMEFSIYKELSEKVVALAMNSLRLFHEEFDYNKIGNPSQDNQDFELQNELVILLNDANAAINKYAIFIPEKWYDKFIYIKHLCREQLHAFNDYVLDGKLKNKTVKAIKTECKKRYDEINDVFDGLVSELREYIATKDTN